MTILYISSRANFLKTADADEVCKSVNKIEVKTLENKITILIFFLFLLTSRIVGSLSIIGGYLTRDPTLKYNPARWLPGFARVPYNAPSACHMHPIIIAIT